MFGLLSVIFTIAFIIFSAGWAFGENTVFACRAWIMAMICVVVSIICGFVSKKLDEF